MTGACYPIAEMRAPPRVRAIVATSPFLTSMRAEKGEAEAIGPNAKWGIETHHDTNCDILRING